MFLKRTDLRETVRFLTQLDVLVLSHLSGNKDFADRNHVIWLVNQNFDLLCIPNKLITVLFSFPRPYGKSGLHYSLNYCAPAVKLLLIIRGGSMIIFYCSYDCYVWYLNYIDQVKFGFESRLPLHFIVKIRLQLSFKI